MRKKIVAANWKMNMTQAESAAFVKSLLLDLGAITDIAVVIIPPFTAIAKVMEALGPSQNIKVGAQNMHWEKNVRKRRSPPSPCGRAEPAATRHPSRHRRRTRSFVTHSGKCRTRRRPSV